VKVKVTGRGRPNRATHVGRETNPGNQSRKVVQAHIWPNVTNAEERCHECSWTIRDGVVTIKFMSRACQVHKEEAADGRAGGSAPAENSAEH
jgi:hypothetical protein